MLGLAVQHVGMTESDYWEIITNTLSLSGVILKILVQQLTYMAKQKILTTPISLRLWYYWTIHLYMNRGESRVITMMHSKRNVWNHLRHCVSLVTVNTTRIWCASWWNFITVFTVRPPLTQNLWWRFLIWTLPDWLIIWCGEAISKSKSFHIHTKWSSTDPSF